jgi:hypothetical protein
MGLSAGLFFCTHVPQEVVRKSMGLELLGGINLLSLVGLFEALFRLKQKGQTGKKRSASLLQVLYWGFIKLTSFGCVGALFYMWPLTDWPGWVMAVTLGIWVFVPMVGGGLGWRQVNHARGSWI